MARVNRPVTEARRLDRLEEDVRMLKLRACSTPTPEEQRRVVRTAVVRASVAFRMAELTLTMLAAGLGAALVAASGVLSGSWGHVLGAALGAGAAILVRQALEPRALAALAAFGERRGSDRTRKWLRRLRDEAPQPSLEERRAI